MADPLTSGGGPFDAYLNPTQPAQPTYAGAGVKPTGWEGKGGQVANIADGFLSGLSKGRALAFQRSEQQNGQRLGLVRQAMSDVSNANIPDSQKQQQLTQLQQLFGQMVYHQIGGDDKGGGKKGGGQGGDGGQHPGDAIKSGVKNFIGSLIGPGGQKENVKPEDLQKTLTGVYSVLRDPNQSLTAQTGQVDQQLYQAADAVKKQNGGVQPTTAQLMQNPAFFKAYSQAMSLTGKPTPGMQALLSTADQQSQQQFGMEKVNAQQAAENQRAALGRDADMQRAQLTAREATTRERETQAAETARAREKTAAEAPLERARLAKEQAEANLAGLKVKQERDAATAVNKSEDYAPGGKSQANPKGDMAVDNLAWEYINTGHMPYLGMGGKSNDKRQIALARAGEIMKDIGIGPADLPAVRGVIKSNSQALSRITTMGSQVQQFENTLQKNLGVAQKLDAAYKRNDTQFLNRIQSAFMTGKGDKEALDLAAQLHGVSREWAKIMAGSTSAAGVPISEAADTDKLMSNAMSSGQLNGLIDNVIKPDAANRIAAVNEEKQSLIQQIRGAVGSVGGGTPPSPNSPPPPRQPLTPGAPPQRQAGGNAQSATQLPKPPQAGAVIDMPSIKQFVAAAGGDPNKAKQMAQQAGWKLPQ